MNHAGELISMRNRAVLASALHALTRYPDRFVVFTEVLLTEVLKLYGEITIIQIGAYVGRSVNDPIFPFVTKHFRGANVPANRLAVLVEPVRHLFEQLARNYEGCSRVVLENAAIAETSGTADFYHLKEGIDLKEHGLPNMFEQLGSLLPDRIDQWDVHHGDPEIQAFIRENTVKQAVHCLIFHELLEKHDLRSLDVLILDVEGSEFEILESIDFRSVQPRFILFESVLLGEKKGRCEQLLARSSYSLLDFGSDTLAFLDYLDPKRLPDVKVS